MSAQAEPARPNSIRAVILDYGMVIARCPAPEYIERIAGAFGLREADFWSRYEHKRLELDRGDIAPREYWRLFAENANTPLTPAHLALLEQWDMEMWCAVEPALLSWAEALQASGFRTALLSNLQRNFAQHLRDNADWLRFFDCQIFSSEVRMTKPDRAIYELCLENLGVRPQQALFIDDRERNVAAAAALGIHAIQYRTLSGLATALRQIGFSPVPIVRR